MGHGYCAALEGLGGGGAAWPRRHGDLLRAPRLRAPRLRFGGKNCGGDRVQGGAGHVKKAAGVILGVRAAGIAARALCTRTARALDSKSARVARSPGCACKERVRETTGGSRGGRARVGWSTGKRASAAEAKQRARRGDCGRRKGKELTCGAVRSEREMATLRWGERRRRMGPLSHSHGASAG